MFPPKGTPVGNLISAFPDVLAPGSLLAGGEALTIRQKFDAAIADIGFELHFKMQDASGTTITNSGSTGSALNGAWTPGAGALAQDGLIGTGEAVQLDGTDSRIAVANNAAISAQTAFEWLFLVKPTGYGESNIGVFFEYHTNVTRLRVNGASGSLQAVVDTDATDATTTTDPGVMTLNEWQLITVAFDSAVDQKIRIYKNGSEVTYLAQTAGTGNVLAQSTGVSVGNSNFQNRTFAGLMDEVARKNGRTLTAQERTAIAAALGL